MNAILVRVGVDQAFGGWNAPVDPDTLEFVYVPIPESDDRPLVPGLATRYSDIAPALQMFGSSRAVDRANRVLLPPTLADRRTHLDPDFAHLTYGDDGERRGKGLTSFGPGDIVVFYAGLRPCRPAGHQLIYAIVGALRVAEVVRAGDVPRARRGENAHTRRKDIRATDVIVRGEPSSSGRLRTCIPIGSFRDGAYRVRPDLLAAWGGLSVRNGFIQRSAVPPRFLDASRFLRWLDAHSPDVVRVNNV